MTISEADDLSLLSRFVQEHSQEAFNELVGRHLNHVYSVCLREVRDASLAEDVTQAVFLILLQKAATIRSGTALTWWLFNTARYASKNALRQQARHKYVEQKLMETMSHQAEVTEAEEGSSLWHEVEPLIHDALATLRDRDREAILLRYFGCKSLKEVGAQQGITENAAQMRVARAVEKVKQHLRKKGVVVPTIVLASLLSERAVMAAPQSCSHAVSQLLSQIATQSLSAAASGSAGTNAYLISKGVLKTMFLSKVKVVATLAGLTLATATVGASYTLHSSDTDANPKRADSATENTVQADTTTSALTPDETLKQILGGYKSLSSFSMDIEHKAVDGGANQSKNTFNQRLRWRKGGRFELLITKESLGNTFSEYYSDGEGVVTVLPDGRTTARIPKQSPDTMFEWEGTGGLILSTLEDGNFAKWVLNPPPTAPFKYQWKWGTRKKWQDMDVHEVILEIIPKTNDRGETEKGSMFISADKKSLVGHESYGRETGKITIYKNQQLNPELPANLGEPPSAR